MQDAEPAVPVVEVSIVIDDRYCQSQDETTGILQEGAGRGREGEGGKEKEGRWGSVELDDIFEY